MVQYLHGDHPSTSPGQVLGSTSLATDESGAEVTGSRTLYYPYGEERWSASGGTLTTDFGFTGQRRERGIGLYDYNARFYDPALGRFVSADTIVPDPGNPQAFNRYSYVLGNPLRYRDPSGHAAVSGSGISPLTEWIEEEYEIGEWNDYYTIGEFSHAVRSGLNEELQDPVYYCGTLAECHGPPVKNKAGTVSRPKFEENEFITMAAFERLLDAVYQDILVEETPGALPWPPASLEAGRGHYETPFWNGRGSDTTVCVEGHGCFKRSEVNYIAQGMWGAQGGESSDVACGVAHGHNLYKYLHLATSGEVYWLDFGWTYYHNRTPTGNDDLD